MRIDQDIVNSVVEHWHKTPLYQQNIHDFKVDTGNLPPHFPVLYYRGNEKAQSLKIEEGLQQLDSSGGTIYVQHAIFLVNQYEPILSGLADKLNCYLGNCEVALYCSSRDCGTVPHFDKNDNLVFQCSGKKRWWVERGPYELPTFNSEEDYQADSLFLTAGSNSEDGIEVVLNPGDMLYVPRGYVHETRSESASSVSVTMTIHPKPAADAVLEIFRHKLIQQIEYRENLPRNHVELWEVVDRLSNDLAGLKTYFQSRANLGFPPFTHFKLESESRTLIALDQLTGQIKNAKLNEEDYHGLTASVADPEQLLPEEIPDHIRNLL